MGSKKQTVGTFWLAFVAVGAYKMTTWQAMTPTARWVVPVGFGYSVLVAVAAVYGSGAGVDMVDSDRAADQLPPWLDSGGNRLHVLRRLRWHLLASTVTGLVILWVVGSLEITSRLYKAQGRPSLNGWFGKIEGLVIQQADSMHLAWTSLPLIGKATWAPLIIVPSMTFLATLVFAGLWTLLTLSIHGDLGLVGV